MKLNSTRLLGLAGLFLVAIAQPAAAHGIGPAENRSVIDFLPLGIEHMLLGWDHLLFIAGIVFLAGEIKRAIKLISVFVLGHSTTLIIATLAQWHINARTVDIIIALSVVFVGIVAIKGRPKDWRWFGAAIFGFGLIHGLGLSTRLQELGLPEDGLLARVIMFNIGLEVGQAMAIVVMFLIADILKRNTFTPRLVKAAPIALIVAGFLAATISAVKSDDGSAAQAGEACEIAATKGLFGGDGGHPSKKFWEPNESAPAKDFTHVIGDGWVVVEYQNTALPDTVTQLRDYVNGPTGTKVVAGASAEATATALTATNAYETLTCSTLQIDELQKFVDEWRADPRSRPTQG
jgi:hydrogenase/urease accessory protein HupE